MLLTLAGFGFTLNYSGVDPSAYIDSYKSKSQEFQKQQIDKEVIYTVSYLPQELQIIQGVNRGSLSIADAQKWLDEKDQQITFIFQIEIPSNGKQEFLKFESDSSSYEERLKYYSFSFKNDINLLVNDKDTIQLNNYNFERDFGISPKGTITISSTLPKKVNKIELIFNDKIYGSQVHSIVFDAKAMASLPQLKNINKWKNHKE